MFLNIFVFKNVFHHYKASSLRKQKRLKKLRNTHNNTPQNNNKQKFVSLIYVKELESFINIFFKKHNINVIYSTKNKLNNIIKLGKDKNQICDNVSVGYKNNCKDCNASYVGQTGRRLNVRIKEHAKIHYERRKFITIHIY